MNHQVNWVVIGRFGRAHGVKGFINIQSFTEPRDNILDYKGWYAFLNNKWRPIEVLDVEKHHKGIIAQIKGYSNRETLVPLIGAEIAVDKKELAPLRSGEYYWYQLIGMEVKNLQGESFGTVTQILPTGSNDVLVVQGEKKHLIPYLPDQFVRHINEEKQEIIVDWDMDF